MKSKPSLAKPKVKVQPNKVELPQPSTQPNRKSDLPKESKDNHKPTKDNPKPKNTRVGGNKQNIKSKKSQAKPKFNPNNNRKITEMFARTCDRTPANGDASPSGNRPLLREAVINYTNINCDKTTTTRRHADTDIQTDVCLDPKGSNEKDDITLTPSDLPQSRQSQLMPGPKPKETQQPLNRFLNHTLSGQLDLAESNANNFKISEQKKTWRESIDLTQD